MKCNDTTYNPENKLLCKYTNLINEYSHAKNKFIKLHYNFKVQNFNHLDDLNSFNKEKQVDILK